MLRLAAELRKFRSVWSDSQHICKRGSAPAHNGVAFGHFARAERQARGHHGREALWDGCHRQRDRNLEVVDGASNLRAQGTCGTL